MHRTCEESSKEKRTIAGVSSVAPRLAVAFRNCALTLALLLSGPVLAAGFSCAQPVTSNAADSSKKGALDKLEEIVIDGSKSTGRRKDLSAWLKLLAGQYSYQGYVDLCGKGNSADQRPVNGKTDCAILQDPREPVRNVRCVVNVRWPEALSEDGATVLGGVSSLAPAVFIYGIEPEMPGIQVMQLDNKGIASHAKGKLIGDTVTSRESCGMSGACQKITRITATPGRDNIAMLIDFEINSERVLRQAFLLHRVSNVVQKSWIWVESP